MKSDLDCDRSAVTVPQALVTYGCAATLFSVALLSGMAAELRMSSVICQRDQGGRRNQRLACRLAAHAVAKWPYSSSGIEGVWHFNTCEDVVGL